MSADYLHGFYLSDLLVEPLKGQVTSKDGTRHLPPTAAEVLLCLAKTPGDLVTRQALLDEVWGKGNGSQEALGHAVSEIRHALDDHADEPIFVQTLRGRGYRLIVIPKLVSDDTSSVVLGTKDGVSLSDIGLLKNLQRRGVRKPVGYWPAKKPAAPRRVRDGTRVSHRRLVANPGRRHRLQPATPARLGWHVRDDAGYRWISGRPGLVVVSRVS
jgi:DNA-binding winged helix-turn-helix (wHTH) protein